MPDLNVWELLCRNSRQHLDHLDEIMRDAIQCQNMTCMKSKLQIALIELDFLRSLMCNRGDQKLL